MFKIAIENKKCQDCDKSNCCKWVDTLNKFDEEIASAKAYIPVEIDMKNCPEFKEVEK